MNIQGEDYSINYEAQTGVTRFEGSLRLNGTEEYAPISAFLTSTLEQENKSQLWDLTALEFLNSSGINMMYKFIISLRSHPDVDIKVVGSNSIAWQAKSLGNMRKFLPRLDLEIK